MASKEIVDYIKQELRAGHSPADISKALTDVGWEKTEVESAFAEIGMPETSPAPVSTASPEVNTPTALDEPQFPHVETSPKASPIASEPVAGTEVTFDAPAGITATARPAAEPVATPAQQATPASGGSLLSRNMATRPSSLSTGSLASPELQGSGLGHLQARTGAAPSNLPMDSGEVAPPSTTPASRLAGQSTGGSLADFTGASASPVSPVKTVHPAALGNMVTPQTSMSAGIGSIGGTKTSTMPVQTIEPTIAAQTTEVKQKKKAGAGWYFFMGLLCGMLITLLLIGLYINFLA